MEVITVEQLPINKYLDWSDYFEGQSTVVHDDADIWFSFKFKFMKKGFARSQEILGL